MHTIKITRVLSDQVVLVACIIVARVRPRTSKGITDRVQFAEFLQHSSLKRLGMLYLTTCVGFGYGLC